MKKALKYLRVIHLLGANISESVGMNWWKKAHNDCVRLRRFKTMFIMLIGFLVTSSCDEDKPTNTFHATPDMTYVRYVDKRGIYQYDVVIIDGCEYVVVDNGYATWGSHKGNCKNPIHQRPER